MFVLSPSELRPGDLVQVDATWVCVIDEAMTMHRGMGIFDDFELLVGARVKPVDSETSTLRTWQPTDRVLVRRTATTAPD